MEQYIMKALRDHARMTLFLIGLLVIFLCLCVWVWLSNSQQKTTLTLGNAQGLYYAEADALANSPYEPGPTPSPISGLPCDLGITRPLAIVYSGDPETRQHFAGIAEASFVVEMAHRYPSGATRIMGVFDCVKPFLVGPLRAGRVDFLNIAASFNAIYVPSGSDSVSRSLLSKGVLDHIDCRGQVPPQGNVDACFVRDAAVSPLVLEDRHYADAVALFAQARSEGYVTTNDFDGFEHAADIPRTLRNSDGLLEIGYDAGFEVTYAYNEQFNRYDRYFFNQPEYDINTGKRVAPRNVIVLKTDRSAFTVDNDYVSRGLLDPFADVPQEERIASSGNFPNFSLGDAWFDDVSGGPANFYLNGQEIVGSWKRNRSEALDALESSRSPFIFLDGDEKEIEFVPGQIWLHVLDESRQFRWL